MSNSDTNKLYVTIYTNGSNEVNGSVDSGTAHDLNPNNILDLHFTEDIYSMSIIGKLSFIDQDGIFATGVISGKESIRIKYGVTSKDLKTVYLRAYRLNQNPGSNTDTTIKKIDLYLVDYYYQNMFSYVNSKGYKDKKVSEIVKDIATNFVKIKSFKNFEDTDDNKFKTFVWPMCSPGLIIKDLSRKGKSSKTSVSGYLFFPTTEKVSSQLYSYNFVTLQSLLKQTSLLKVGEGGCDGTYFFYSKDYSPGDYSKILDFKSCGTTMQFDSELIGPLFAGYNLTGKNPLLDTKSFEDMYEKIAKLGDSTPRSFKDGIGKPLFTGEYDSKIITNMQFDRFIKTYCLQFMYQIKVAGHQNRYTGSMIEIALPGTDGSDGSSANSALKGNYLIKSITHTFKSTASIPYIQNLVCIKNAFFKS